MDTSRGINWVPAIFLITYQAFLLASFPFYAYYSPPSLAMVIWTVILLFATGTSITAGYHRYFSHRAFKAHPIVEFALLFFGTMGAQGSVLRWAYDHRLHHAHVDTDDDPYSIKKGFWYAHFIWILEKPRTIEPRIVSDLLKNKWIVFQDRYYGILMVLTNVIAYYTFAWLLNDSLGAFFMIVLLRMFLLHHFTWFINSLAHTWGDKPFCTEQSAVDNYLISLVTFGEGYHNYHHTYANDYRNGIRWYHFDPTKWLIWSLNKLNLTTDLKRMDPYTIKKRMIQERKELLSDKLKELWYVKRDELEAKIHELSENILHEIAEFKKLTDAYRKAKQEKSSRDMVKEIKAEIKKLNKQIKADWKQWQKISSKILHLQTLSPLQTSS